MAPAITRNARRPVADTEHHEVARPAELAPSRWPAQKDSALATIHHAATTPPRAREQIGEAPRTRETRTTTSSPARATRPRRATMARNSDTSGAHSSETPRRTSSVRLRNQRDQPRDGILRKDMNSHDREPHPSARAPEPALLNQASPQPKDGRS